MIVSGLSPSSVAQIEKEFGLPSKVSGAILASNDASALAFVLIVSYFGEKGKKPKWLGIGAIMTGEYPYT